MASLPYCRAARRRCKTERARADGSAKLDSFRGSGCGLDVRRMWVDLKKMPDDGGRLCVRGGLLRCGSLMIWVCRRVFAYAA